MGTADWIDERSWSRAGGSMRSQPPRGASGFGAAVHGMLRQGAGRPPGELAGVPHGALAQAMSLVAKADPTDRRTRGEGVETGGDGSGRAGTGPVRPCDSRVRREQARGVRKTDPLRDFLSRLIGMAILLTASSGGAVVISFETLPDGTPMPYDPFTCGEVEYDAFRPWGVLFSPRQDEKLDIRASWCLVGYHALTGACGFPFPGFGTLDVTFVIPGTNLPAVADSINLFMLTQTQPVSNNRVNVYDQGGSLIYSEAMHSGVCREDPFYIQRFRFAAPGQIARVENILYRGAVIDDFAVVGLPEATTVEEGTWGRVKTFYWEESR